LRQDRSYKRFITLGKNLKPSKKIITLIIVISAVAVILILKCSLFSKSNSAAIEDFRTKGNPDAPIKIIEYLDFQCPSCAYASKVIKEQMSSHPDLIHVTLRHFPLSMHRHGVLASTYVECAARQNKFWEFHDKTFENQDAWKKLSDARPAFELIALDLQLNIKKLNSCLRDVSISEIIESHKQEGKAKGVRSTPSLFINGELLVGVNTLPQKLNQLVSQFQSNVEQ